MGQKGSRLSVDIYIPDVIPYEILAEDPEKCKGRFEINVEYCDGIDHQKGSNVRNIDKVYRIPGVDYKFNSISNVYVDINGSNFEIPTVDGSRYEFPHWLLSVCEKLDRAKRNNVKIFYSPSLLAKDSTEKEFFEYLHDVMNMCIWCISDGVFWNSKTDLVVAKKLINRESMRELHSILWGDVAPLYTEIDDHSLCSDDEDEDEDED